MLDVDDLGCDRFGLFHFQGQQSSQYIYISFIKDLIIFLVSFKNQVIVSSEQNFNHKNMVSFISNLTWSLNEHSLMSKCLKNLFPHIVHYHI